MKRWKVHFLLYRWSGMVIFLVGLFINSYLNTLNVLGLILILTFLPFVILKFFIRVNCPKCSRKMSLHNKIKYIYICPNCSFKIETGVYTSNNGPGQ